MATDGLRWETSNEAANGVTAVPAGLRLVPGHFDVHLQGDVAWVEGPRPDHPCEGDERPVWMSGVLVREHGRWVMVQSYASLPVQAADILKLSRFN
jgi:hypothetical protein